jgi:hypothetical protein
VVFSFVTALAGCGGSSGSSNSATGPYSNATLNGTYAFVFSGKDAGGFFGVAGTLQSNAAGVISSGLMDINSSAGVFTSVPFTGTYTIQPDGEGSATLTSAARNFSLRFIVIFGASMRITSFDNNSSGHGNLNQFQPTPAFTLNDTLLFHLSGIDGAALPLLTMGAFTGDGAGNINAGVQDISDNGLISAKQSVTGTYTLPVGGRGTLTLTTALGVLHFAYYVAGFENLKIVEIERGPALAGETAVGRAVPSLSFLGCGPCVFSMSGISGGRPDAEAGVFVASHGSEDINVGGVVSRISFLGDITVDPAFRGTMTMGTRTFAVYPSFLGLFMMEIDAGQLVSGMAFNDPFGDDPHADLAFDGNYGLSLAGQPFAQTIDEVGRLTAKGPPGGTVAGQMSMIVNGVPAPGLSVTGSFLLDGTGRGTVTLQTPAGTQHLVVYVTGGFGPLQFVGADSNFVVAGTLEMQQ